MRAGLYLLWTRLGIVAFGGAALFAIALMIRGCERSPLAEIDQARSALDEARREGAETWASQHYAHARALFDSANDELNAQAVRWGVSRDYAAARELLAAARLDAITARDASRTERERAKEEAQESLKRARTAVQSARAALRIAPSPRDGRSELERLRGELRAVEMELPGVEALVQAGDYRAAASRALAMEAKVQDALSRFFDSIERRTGRSSRNMGRPGGPRRRAAGEPIAWCLPAAEGVCWSCPTRSRGREVPA